MNKLNINWPKLIVFAIIAGGLVLLTGSFLMSAGIFLLLFVVAYFLGDLEDNYKRKKQRQESNQDEATH